MLNLLSTAISNLNFLSFDYDGDDAVRTVEPHTLGLNKDGELMLSAYQTSGDRPGWRLFRCGRISGLQQLGTAKFEAPREGYKQGDKRMAHIVQELAA